MTFSTTKHLALSLYSSTERLPFIQLFEQAGFTVTVFDRFGEVMAGVSAALTRGASVLIVASVQHGGLALVEALRRQPTARHIPVVVIDTEGDIKSAIRALQLGVLDYFVHETDDAGEEDEVIRPRIAMAYHRVAATREPVKTKRAGASSPPRITAVGDGTIAFEPALRGIRKNDMWVSLSPIEWRLFETLSHSRGQVVSFADLVTRGLNRTTVSANETSLLRLHVSRLRAKLHQSFGGELNIITLRGRGYMLA